jgi:hypothetical protein
MVTYQHSIAYYIILRKRIDLINIPVELRRYYLSCNSHTFNDIEFLKRGYSGFCLVRFHDADRRLGLSHYFRNNKESWFDEKQIYRKLDAKATRDVYLTPDEEQLRQTILSHHYVRDNVSCECWFEIGDII